MFVPSHKTRMAWDQRAASAFSFESVVFVCAFAALFLALIHGMQLTYTGYYQSSQYLLMLYEIGLPLLTLVVVIVDLVLFGAFTLKPRYALIVAFLMTALWVTQSAGWIVCDVSTLLQDYSLCSEEYQVNYGWTSFSVLVPDNPAQLGQYFINYYGTYDASYPTAFLINRNQVQDSIKYGKISMAIAVAIMYICYIVASIRIIVRQRRKLYSRSHTCTCCLEHGLKMLESDSTDRLPSNSHNVCNDNINSGAPREVVMAKFSGGGGAMSNRHTSRGVTYADSTSYGPSVAPSTRNESTLAGDGLEVSYEISAIDETESRRDLEEGYAPSVSSRCLSIDTQKTRYTSMTLNSTVIGSDSTRRAIPRKAIPSANANPNPFADRNEGSTPSATSVATSVIESDGAEEVETSKENRDGHPDSL